MIAPKHAIIGHTTFEKINLNHTCYFFDDIKILLGMNKTCMKNTDAFVYADVFARYEQKVYESEIDREIPLCLSFSDVGAYIIKENENKYLIFALTENNKKVLDLYQKLWSEIKKQIKSINSGKSIKYKNDFMKIRLDSYDDLPLNKILWFSVLNILCQSVFRLKLSIIHKFTCMSVNMSVSINF